MLAIKSRLGKKGRPTGRTAGRPSAWEDERRKPPGDPRRGIFSLACVQASWPIALADLVARWKTVISAPAIAASIDYGQFAARSAAPVNGGWFIRPDHTMAKRIVCAAGVVRARSSFRDARLVSGYLFNPDPTSSPEGPSILASAFCDRAAGASATGSKLAIARRCGLHRLDWSCGQTRSWACDCGGAARQEPTSRDREPWLRGPAFAQGGRND